MEETLTNAVEVLLQEVPTIPLVTAVKIAHKILAFEREACAKLIDSHPQAQLATQYDWTRRIGQDLAAAIRMRSNGVERHANQRGGRT